MKSNWWYRFGFMFFVLVISLLTVIPTVKDVSKWSWYPFENKVNLGLDLQGGLYIVLGIDFHKVYREELNTGLKRAVAYLEGEGIAATVGASDTTIPNDPKQKLIVTDPLKTQEVIDKLKRNFGVRLTGEEKNALDFGLELAKKADIENNSVSKSIEVIRNRIDEFGVTEPEIFSQGKERIVVQLPGVKDIERAKSLIGQTAKLEFRAVNDEVSEQQILDWVKKAEEGGVVFEKGSKFSAYITKLNEFLKPTLPEGYNIAFERSIDKKTNEVLSQFPYLLQITPGVTGEDLEDASVAYDQQSNTPYVALSFNSAGAKLFDELSGKMIGKRLAIVLDGNVYSAPVIQARISGGTAQITLNGSNSDDMLSQATELALVLRAGALPVELEFQEQRVVGPSLGNDSIQKAQFASLLGCIVLFAFIVLWYKTSGVIAVVGLLFNVLIVMAFLVGLEATLTLPGIAGIALTVAMAVDANIIVYERIKEELRAGMSVVAAVDAGFDRAFWTILDANLTTAAAGIALLNFGTGPVRGFAVTLLIGIASTIYTAYFLNHLMFQWYMDRNHGKEISI